jgi:hypothetical protein
MVNVCHHCGNYHAEKVIDPAGPYAICPDCGHRHSFHQMPLLIISGASGAGKSTVCHYLLGTYTRAVLLDSDILWRTEFNTPENDYKEYFELWLRMCKNIAQSGRVVALFGAGEGVPSNLENLIERRYFSRIHYLALVCSDGILAERLRRRPQWRGSHLSGFIESQQSFNSWFKTYQGQPEIQILDTSSATLEETGRQVSAWITGRLDAWNKERAK